MNFLFKTTTFLQREIYSISLFWFYFILIKVEMPDYKLNTCIYVIRFNHNMIMLSENKHLFIFSACTYIFVIE